MNTAYRNRFISTIFTVLAILTVHAAAIETASAQQSNGDVSYASLDEFAILNTAVEHFLQGSRDIQSIRQELFLKKEEFESIQDAQMRNYLIGQLHFILAILDEGEKQDARAVENFEKSLEHAELAMMGEPFSDGYRLLADTYTHLMKHRGVVFQLSNGMKIRHYAELAIEMDSGNDKARISLALFLFNAPVIAGGDPRKSIEMLNEIDDKQDLHPIDRYSTFIWLAIGYSEEDNESLSQYYLTKALEMYPRNLWIDDLLKSHDL
jgi:hypothetical protein